MAWFCNSVFLKLSVRERKNESERYFGYQFKYIYNLMNEIQERDKIINKTQRKAAYKNGI